jgi:ComF family protein
MNFTDLNLPVLKKYYRAGLDICFPRSCANCGSEADSPWSFLCWNCISKLFIIQKPVCEICGTPFAGESDDEFICPQCSAKRPHFDKARAVMEYSGIAQKLIQDFKYHNAIFLASDFGKLMKETFEVYYSDNEIDEVIFVPLFHAKQRERSYNQSELLAKQLFLRLHKPLTKAGLYRKKATISQTRLTSAQRGANLKNVFGIKYKALVQNKRFLLVDDVFTTGSTVNECAKVLKRNGAKRVNVLTLARD